MTRQAPEVAAWQDIDLEESLIALRLVREAMHDTSFMHTLIRIGVTRDDFPSPVLASLWDVMVRVTSEIGRPDRHIVQSGLVGDGLRAADSHRELFEMIEEAAPLGSSSDAQAAVSVLRRRIGLRRMARLGIKIREATDDFGNRPEDVIRMARTEIDAIEQVARARTGVSSKALAHAIIEMMAKQREPWATVPTGLPAVDRALGGGIARGGSFVLIAGTGDGKTTIARHSLLVAARHAKERGEQVVYVSFEASDIETARELVQTIAGVRYSQDVGPAAAAALQAAAIELDGLPIVFENREPCPMVDVLSAVRAHHREKPVSTLFVDYIQDVQPPVGMREGQEAHALNSVAMRGFLAKENIAGFLLSQIAADAIDRHPKDPIRAEDTAGSKRYAKDARAVARSRRKRDSKNEAERNLSRVNLLKNRDLGDLVEQFMRWDRETTRITPCDEHGRDAAREDVVEGEVVA